MAKPLGRFKHGANLWKEGVWGAIVALLYGAFGAALEALDAGLFGPNPKRLAAMIPTLSTAWWVAGGILLFLVWCFEASYRLQKKSNERIEALETDLASSKRITRDRMAEFYAADRLKLADLLVHATAAVFSSPKMMGGPMLGPEVLALAQRFTADVEFGEKWNAFLASAIECHQNSIIRTSVVLPDLWEQMREVFVEHYGKPMMARRDDVTAYLLRMD